MVSRAEVLGVVKAVPDDNAPLKSVDAGKFVVIDWVEQRRPGEGEMAGTVHTEQTEIYVIVEGTAKLRTGGKLTPTSEDNGEGGGRSGSGKPPVPAGPWSKLKTMAGTTLPRNPTPTFHGPIEGGETRTVKQGDVVVIPANTCHQWISIDSPLLVYETVRVDPEKRWPPSYTHPLLAKK
jgi:mannose-6-phosphate isomerase-like protein (cupin superfamily)